MNKQKQCRDKTPKGEKLPKLKINKNKNKIWFAKDCKSVRMKVLKNKMLKALLP